MDCRVKPGNDRIITSQSNASRTPRDQGPVARGFVLPVRARLAPE
jgi:hypothetical protein